MCVFDGVQVLIAVEKIKAHYYYNVMLIFAYHNRLFFKIMIVLFELIMVIVNSSNGNNRL